MFKKILIRWALRILAKYEEHQIVQTRIEKDKLTLSVVPNIEKDGKWHHVVYTVSYWIRNETKMEAIRDIAVWIDGHLNIRYFLDEIGKQYLPRKTQKKKKRK